MMLMIPLKPTNERSHDQTGSLSHNLLSHLCKTMVNFTSLSLDSIRENAAQWFLYASSFLGTLGISSVHDPRSACAALQGLDSIQNTTILSAIYYPAPVTAIPLQIVPFMLLSVPIREHERAALQSAVQRQYLRNLGNKG